MFRIVQSIRVHLRKWRGRRNSKKNMRELLSVLANDKSDVPPHQLLQEPETIRAIQSARAVMGDSTEAWDTDESLSRMQALLREWTESGERSVERAATEEQREAGHNR